MLIRNFFQSCPTVEFSRKRGNNLNKLKKYLVPVKLKNLTEQKDVVPHAPITGTGHVSGTFADPNNLNAAPDFYSKCTV